MQLRPTSLSLALFALVGAMACSRKEAPLAPMRAATDGGLFGDATLHGTVTFHGIPPPPVSRPSRSSFPDCSRLPAPPGDPSLRLSDAGQVAEAFVWVKDGLPPGDYPPPETPVTLDQRDCEFVPRVLGIQVGQPLDLVNSDPLLHNVHTPRDFNLPMPHQGMRVTRVFKQPAVMTNLVCDVHGWMRAYAGVVPHPFFALTAPDGSYTIERLPAGHYTVEVWHERLGRQSHEVTLGRGENGTIDFDISTH